MCLYSSAGTIVCKSVLATQGVAGPSMADSYIWRWMLVFFKAASVELCNTLADVAWRIAPEHVDPAGLTAVLNNYLITLDKNFGICPICIGEMLCRIIGKSVIIVLRKDIMHAVGSRRSVLVILLALRLPFMPCVPFLKHWAQMLCWWMMLLTPSIG